MITDRWARDADRHITAAFRLVRNANAWEARGRRAIALRCREAAQHEYEQAIESETLAHPFARWKRRRFPNPTKMSAQELALRP